ncbi:glycosyltransferase [Streptomyces sp. AV19]|uniref:glycosyltransferase n=1 Tax=Streptomyces sp. AV19 TaxID=2793068 RepID=UPI0018FEEE91|nr:glycosyltransferase [Streptomyces sp. AV19]MBH1937188.1 glycosyltransferase [Streptomyces sp. AV19]MDG4533461.1 glycosyltransferase [Streptomyces sp. AV19]
MSRITVGMATYDDYDGVYFTLQALRLGHATELSDAEFVVVDNNPSGPAAPALRALADHIPGCRYLPFDRYASTAVRDLVFRVSRSPVTLCLDSHVLLAPGSVHAVLDHFEQRPHSRDLLQGPMIADVLDDDREPPSTHLHPEWGDAMFGTWRTDPRGTEPGGKPFEVGMQGLGLFACRTDAWPGLNPRFRAHGGEEGYLHEKVRRGGGRVLCHPGVRWLHRFTRPQGPSFPVGLLERVRNYLIGHRELGLDSGGLTEHLHDLVGEEQALDVLDRARRQLDSPLAHFDAVVCLLADGSPRTWERATGALAELDADWLAEWLTPAPDAEEQGGREAALRQIAADAAGRGLDRVLILDAASLRAPGAAERLRQAVGDLRTVTWSVRPLTAAGSDCPGLALRGPMLDPVARGERPALAAAAPWLDGAGGPQ